MAERRLESYSYIKETCPRERPIRPAAPQTSKSRGVSETSHSAHALLLLGSLMWSSLISRPRQPLSMQEFTPPAQASESSITPSPEPAGRKFAVSRTIAAWATILLAVIVIVLLTQMAGEPEEMAPQMTNASNVFQGKYIVGFSELAPSFRKEMRDNVSVDYGSASQRLQNVIVAADVSDAEQAREKMEAVREVMESEDKSARSGDRESYVTKDDHETLRILETLYNENTTQLEAIKELPAEDRDHLTENLGWFGELALAPRDGDAAARAKVVAPAKNVAIGSAVGVIVLCLTAFLGFVCLVALLVFVATGNIRSRMPPGEVHRQLYLETFAIWIVGVFVAQIFVGALAEFLPKDFRMVPMLFVFFGSLAVLLWPKLHGYSFGQIAKDIGWTFPRPFWATPLFGLSGYIAGIPILGCGLVMTLILTMLTASTADVNELAPAGGPAHPIVMQLMGGNFWLLLQVFLLGSVAAPVVEETMFRGVFYRYLRQATRWRTMAFSIIFGTLVNCFIFAAIHPQGLVTIPVLMSLAIAFTLSRELLDSVYPAMIMHGISNSIALTVGVFVFSS